MRTSLQFLLTFSFLALITSTGFGATTIYSTNFGTTSGTFPTGWSTSSGSAAWTIVSTSASTTPTYSGSMNATATNGSTLASATLTCNPGISTVGYTNITVMYAARRTSTFTNAVTLEWSTDGSTWNALTFTEVTNDGNWAWANSGTRITLPAGAEGASNLRFRRVFTQISGSGTYRMDDFSVEGTASGPTITLTTTGFSGAFGFVKVGNSSSSSSFTVSAISLTDNLVLTPPTGFEIRTGSNSFSTSAINLTPSGGAVSSTTVDVRFTPLSYVAYSGSVSCTSTGAGTQYATVSGTGGIKSVATGNWSSGTTWDGGTAPTSDQNVYISASYPVTIDDGTAVCNSITFDPSGSSGFLVMGSASSVLSVYGDFTLGSTSQTVFGTSWPAGAKVKFTGSATQTLSGWSTSAFSTSMDEIVVDKSGGKVVTSAANMRFGIGNSLDIVNGTFEVASADDIEGRTYSGTASSPNIIVRAGATFNMVGGASHIRRASNTAEETSKIGTLTVYGTANLATSSTNRLNFTSIVVENGGLVEFPLNRDMSGSVLNCGSIVVNNGGTCKNDLSTTSFWYTNTTTPQTVIINSGGEYEVAASSTTFPSGGVTQNAGSAIRYSSSNATTLYSGITTYKALILSGAGSKTLTASISVDSLLQLSGAFTTLSLGSYSLTYNAGSKLRYGASGQLTAETTTDAEWPAAAGPQNIQIYNSGGVTLHASRTVSGTLTLTAGTLNQNSQTLTIASGASVVYSGGSVTPALIYPASLTNFAPPSGTTVGSMTVNGAVSLTNGSLTVSDGATLTLGNSGSIGTESAGHYVIGKVQAAPLTINGTTASNIAGLGVTIAPGTNTLGSTTVTRISGTAGYVAQGDGSINRRWKITPTNQPASAVDVTLKWVADDDNGKTLSAVAVWKSDNDGVTWQKIAGGLNGSSRSVTFSTSGFSDFTITGDEDFLPVELNSFASSVQGRFVKLEWTTATERNSYKFIVERTKGTEGIWVKAGEVKASDYSNSPKTYGYTDKTTNTGKYSYRLKMIDNDGTYKYSDVVEATVAVPVEFKVSKNYPNPFNPSTRITCELPSDTRMAIELYTITGQRIAVLFNDYIAAGYYDYTLNMAPYNLASGLYLYKISGREVASGKELNYVNKMMYLK